MSVSRRKFLGGLLTVIVAPAIPIPIPKSSDLLFSDLGAYDAILGCNEFDEMFAKMVQQMAINIDREIVSGLKIC